jgi:radical SAM superfamily enzyme YgiQ (UPF0313 family)
MRYSVLFVQLPLLDNEAVARPGEGVTLAADYLAYSIERAGLTRRYPTARLDPATLLLDDRHLADRIALLDPWLLVVTLYLWNVERTLTLLRTLKKRQPRLLVAAGGPEVAPRHPFLFRNGCVDVAVTGEGETVFPEILEALRQGRRVRARTVAWRTGRTYTWGSQPVPTLPLRDLLPPPQHAFYTPDPQGMAYLETSRGCPMNCAFCCYNQRRKALSFLSADDVAARVRTLIRRGTREIRFIDPTFNSNPDFRPILSRLAALNPGRRIRFFAELRADTLTPEDVRKLDEANVREVEVGVQSTTPSVLKGIRRPSSINRVQNGLRLLHRHSIRLTIDLMCGLPGQSLADIRLALRWVPPSLRREIQFLHTLLIPGTELRDRARTLGIRAQPRPPYRVIETPSLSEGDIRRAETLAERALRSTMDCPTSRFVGPTLPDLFPEVVTLRLDQPRPPRLPGQTSRRALVLPGANLYARRSALAGILRAAIRQEPHILWQFVLAPVAEEPLDLFEELTAEIDRAPGHYVDRFLVRGEVTPRAARRLMVRLPRGAGFSRAWVSAAERMLSSLYH